MTPAERKALAFLAVVAALGAGTRAARAPKGDVRMPETRAALARQLERVDSARRAGRSRRGRGGGGRERGGGAAGDVRGVRTPPGRDATGPLVVDLDVAGAAEIERLPRLGPALARRVVADRDSNGPYGSLAALERVRGIGPGVAKTLAPHVTFSGTPRPTSAEPDRGAERTRDAPGPRSDVPRRRAPRPPSRGAAAVVSP